MSPPGHRAGRDDDAVVAELALQLGFVRRFAMSCGVPPQCLDDFVSAVAVTALERISAGAFRMDPEKTLRGSVRAWLVGIVRFRAKDVRRKVTFRGRIVVPGPTEEHPVDVDVAVPSPEGQILAREALDAVGRLKMSPTQRECVRLTALGFTAREIGDRLGIPEETAASCVKRMRMAWKRRGGRSG